MGMRPQDALDHLEDAEITIAEIKEPAMSLRICRRASACSETDVESAAEATAAPVWRQKVATTRISTQ